MTNKDILYQAILKAEQNGFKEHLNLLPFIKTQEPENLVKTIFLGQFRNIIFNHNFAKAFFGEFKGDGKLFEDGERFSHFNENGWPVVDRDWRYHLPIMVMEKEPLKYLEKFLKDK